MRTLTVSRLNFPLSPAAVLTVVIMLPIPSVYLSYNWKFVAFDTFIQFSLHPPCHLW